MKIGFPVIILITAICILAGCAKKIDNTGTCDDGRKNQGEQGVDCGGPCPDVCASCADGIMNQGEKGVDCGGPCDPCYSQMTSTIQGNKWSSTSRNALLSGPGTLRIYGTDQLSSITIYYSGLFTEGTTQAGQSFTAEYRDINGTLYTSTTFGTITFTTFDSVGNVVTGTFTFDAVNAGTGNKISVSAGVFNVLEY
jgi:uncharacterized protein DUF6252